MACPLASIPFLPGDSLRVMSHSQPHGCFRGLSREEKHLPDSRIPQLRRDHSFGRGDEWTGWGAQGSSQDGAALGWKVGGQD